MTFKEYKGGTHLSHHGIDGQQWGVRNGPPYPLDSGEKYTRRKYKKRDIKHMSNEELDEAITRLTKERYFQQLVSDINHTTGSDIATKAATKAAEGAAKKASETLTSKLVNNILYKK